MVEVVSMTEQLEQELRELEAQHLRRRLLTVEGVLPGGKVRVDSRELLNLSSNDYLGLAQDGRLIRAAQEAAGLWGAGATASRLISGTFTLHAQVEAETAAFKGTARALVFNTGYMANLGVIAALTGKGDVVLSDRLNHASIVDGIRLSGAKLVRFRHRDLNHLEDLLKQSAGARRRLIVTDTVFSVDGDAAPLAEMAALKERHGAWLMVDEAHATGVLGPWGAGLAAALGVTEAVDVHMGTFSKALGCLGAYVAGSSTLIDYLINRARSFIYATALPPPVLGAISAALQITTGSPDLRQRLSREAKRFRGRLAQAGLDTLESDTQIVPVLVGDNALALDYAARLRDQGLLAVAIRPPTVPPGGARLRFSLSAAHSSADLKAAAETIIAVGRELGLGGGEN